jgi:sialate O-acetylesterase
MRLAMQSRLAATVLVTMMMCGCQKPATGSNASPVSAPSSTSQGQDPNAPASTPLRLAGVFTDNMVLQQGMPVPIWGWAGAGDSITVSFAGQTKECHLAKATKWTIQLDPMKAGTTGEMVVKGPRNTVTLKNVAVGEVWFCSGQSNMFFLLRDSANAATAIPAANYPQVRMFRVKRVGDLVPREDCQGQWLPATPETAPTFSAIAYFYGLELHKNLNVPIGLLEASWGGSTAESWMSQAALQDDPAFAGIMKKARKYREQTDWAQVDRDNAALAAKYKEAIAAWNVEAAKAKAEGSRAPAQPRAPRYRARPESNGRYVSTAYNGMLAPVIPYAIKGAVWYQGETNAEEGRGIEYRKVLPGLICNWRNLWSQGDFPFLIVQLPGYHARNAEPSEGNWAELREAQLLTTQALPKVGMAVTIDLGDARNIHPTRKEEVGQRLAMAALGTFYGKANVTGGPLFDSVKMENGKAVIRFRNVGGGLVAKDDQFKGFAIAGQDRKFVWATATIEGDSVVVWSEKVAKPAAVRYEWADNPECNLYNKEGLPASPFRTDDWLRPAPAAATADSVPDAPPAR